MLGYVTLGTNDMDRAALFYDGLLSELGAKRILELEALIAWAVTSDAPAICLVKPFDGKTATVGNGMMVALAADSSEKVDQIYQKAIELGGKDEGAPGPRGGGSFYAGYFRDLDGNKLNAFFMG